MSNVRHKDQLALVAEFCTHMQQPVSQGWGDVGILRLGGNLVKEESRELHEALSFFIFDDQGPEAKEHVIKELCDVLYVTYWLAARIGVDVNEAFRRVHASNMSKLVEGKPFKDASGKVLKGPHYRPPDLADIVARTPITL